MDVGTILSAAQTVLTTLDSLKLKEMCSIFGYESQLDGLRDTVSTINVVLRDAEIKQQLSAQEQKLIEDLKGAVYEADDLLDEFVTRIERKNLSKAVKKLHLLSFFNKIGVAFKMSQGIDKIKKMLDAIANNIRFSFKLDPQPLRNRRPETCSYVDATEIIGRDDDLEKIVGMLLDSNVESNVSILSIVGIGGLGKTTLAQLLFNDEKIKSALPLRIWTCVADQDQKEFDVKEILCKILDQNDHNSSMEKVQSELRARLNCQKYLLVLDDVWTKRRDLWDDLVKYLNGGEKGSRIVVTTRSLETAGIIDGGQIYELQGLSKDDSWRLFEISAFGSHQPNHRDDLVKIGQDIAKGCVGVPLAIKVAGSFLYG